MRQLANVRTAILEDVVGHEDDRHGAHELRDLLLTSDPLLQCREGQWPVVAEGEHFAVEDGAIRQAAGGGGDLGEAVGDELLAARPEVQDTSAFDELRAYAIPLPLDEPAADVSQRLHRILERRREKERIRPRAIVVGALVREERGEPFRGWRPLAHDPRCQRSGWQLRRLGQSADDEGLRDADAQLASDELEEDEALQPIERAPPGGDALLLRCGIQALERQDAVLDPARKRQILGWGRRQLVEDERRRLRAVADDGVALFEDPGR